MERTSSIYLNVKLNDLASLIFLFLTSVLGKYDLYENKKVTRRVAQLFPLLKTFNFKILKSFIFQHCGICDHKITHLTLKHNIIVLFYRIRSYVRGVIMIYIFRMDDIGVNHQIENLFHVHLYICPSDELSHFQLIFIVRSYVVLLFHCQGEGWDPANMFNPATLFMYVPVPSQEPVIQWLSFVYVLHICFSFLNKAVSFLV